MKEQVMISERSLERAFASKFSMHMFIVTIVIFTLSYIGSRQFTHIDLNLYGYVVGTLVFLGGLFYRFIMWSERPPAKVFIRKGWKLLFRKKTAEVAVNDLTVYKFIWNRGIFRWTQHMLIGWGVIISCMVTFPLVFGWMYFTMAENGYYTVVFMSLDLMTIPAESFMAHLFYNALNISAFMVIAGVCMALYRRVKNMQARAEQTFIYDFMPLYMLLFVSVTGLLLTTSNLFLEGWFQPTLSIIHQFAVVVTLIYLPFGKLAHIPMRPLGIFVKNYRDYYSKQSMKECKVCSNEFVSTEQSNDVVDLLNKHELDFHMKEGFHLSELCLPCRRKYRISIFSGKPTHHSKVKELNQDARG